MTTRNIKPASIFDTGAHTRTELKKIGRSLREQVPLHEHELWEPAGNRVDPIDILQSQDAVRLQELIPVRYGRMLASPFSFFRGASAVMAGDLAGTPTTKVNVQACCDAHIDNFGIYASAERQIVFDLNDFDETLPAPPLGVRRQAIRSEHRTGCAANWILGSTSCRSHPQERFGICKRSGEPVENPKPRHSLRSSGRKFVPGND